MTGTRRILAFDQDESFLKGAENQLKKVGLQFAAVRELAQILSQVASFKPDLILLDRGEPGTAAGVVADLLRDSSIPLAFVVSDSSVRELIRAVQAHGVEMLPRPFGPEQANRLVALLDELSRRPRVDGAWEDQVARNFMDLAKRNKLRGSLVVNRATPFEGRVVLKDGSLVRASYGPLSGMDAVREILQLEDGVYELDSDLEHPAMKVAHSATELEPGRAVTGIAAADTADNRPRLLAVDDEPEMLTLISKYLARAGFEVDTASDGKAAIEAALATPYDLIIADLNMPRMDGWEMLKVLKTDHRTRDVPVIFLSAHDDLRETLRAARAGAHDYLAKDGRLDVMVSAALRAITPRLEVLFHLLVEEPVLVRTQVVGLQWLLRAVARLRTTGTLELKDDWGSYRMTVRDGNPLDIEAKVQRTVTGLPAFARIMVANMAHGAFTPGEVKGNGSVHLSMEELILRTCDGLNAAKARAAEQRLAASAKLEVDPEYYGLFCRIAPPKKVAFAQSLCERKMPLNDLADALKISQEQALEWFNELLRRGVIKPDSKFSDPTPMPRAF